MKKILAILLAALMACAIFAACSKPEEEPTAQPTVVEAGTPKPTEAATPEPTAADPNDVSPTTGLPGNTTYKPIMVQLDNADAARPQTGISYADIVYETDVDGGDTRFTALFNDKINSNAPEELTVGAVRSSRYYHQWIQEEWDALYVHMGGPDETGKSETDIWGASSEHVKQRINGAGKHADNNELFFALKKGHSTSAFAGIDLMKALDVYDYTPEPLQAFAFYPANDYADQPEIEQIDLNFFGSKKTPFASYEYDKAKDKLLRSTRGKAHTDAATGDQLEVQNVVIQFVHDEKANDGPGSDRRIVDVKGSGDAVFVIHGKLMKGVWERPAYDHKTTYRLENGDELTFAPGNTWITMMPEGREVTVTYADGTDDTLTGEMN